MTINDGDIVLVRRGDGVYQGVLMPSSTGHTVIKLKNGYNVGFSPDTATLEIIEKKHEEEMVIYAIGVCIKRGVSGWLWKQ